MLGVPVFGGPVALRPKEVEVGRYSVSHLAKAKNMSHHILQFPPDGSGWTLNGGSTDLEGRPSKDLGLTLDVVVPKLIEQARRITGSRMATSLVSTAATAILTGSTADAIPVAYNPAYGAVQKLGQGTDIVECRVNNPAFAEPEYATMNFNVIGNVMPPLAPQYEIPVAHNPQYAERVSCGPHSIYNSADTEA